MKSTIPTPAPRPTHPGRFMDFVPAHRATSRPPRQSVTSTHIATSVQHPDHHTTVVRKYSATTAILYPSATHSAPRVASPQSSSKATSLRPTPLHSNPTPLRSNPSALHSNPTPPKPASSAPAQPIISSSRATLIPKLPLKLKARPASATTPTLNSTPPDTRTHSHPATALGVIEDFDAVSTAHSTATHSPKSPFINTDKVEKRPLSSARPLKNVYSKDTKNSSAELPDTPTVVVASPSQGSNLSLAIAIFLTILLGAVVGFVAYFAFFQK
ncbi:MAG: hypothetical protein Q4A30_00535 [Candidatus Saccharibacteria bacterium]|nr:hypothetical protein [Candidatus Saccharibacteria bacterium]